MNRLRGPTLRNIALTAPCMHGGSMSTLSEVLDFYAAGGHLIDAGPYAGDGRSNPYKNGLIIGFDLTTQGRIDIEAFLKSLTDESLLANTRYSRPWVAE